MTDRPSRRRRLRVTVVGGASVPASRGLAAWLARHAPAKAVGEVTIKLLGDRAMAALNGDFRGKPVPTDVLSFPGEGASSNMRLRPTPTPRALSAPRRSLTRDRAIFLGDIAIARGVAARQARAEGHALATELKVLALHGLLHLLGYDHERDSGEMRTVEERLRRRAGLPTGLVARAHGRAPRRAVGR